MPVVLTLDPSTVGVRSTTRSLSVSVFTIDPAVIPVEFGGAIGGALITGNVAAQAGAATVTIDADKVVQTALDVFADPATVIFAIEQFTIIRSSSTIFGPDVSHIATRRDSTVVFVRYTGV